MRRLTRLAISVAFLWLLAHTILLFTDGFRQPTLPSDVAVVLGSRVYPSGQPSSGLERRLERAEQIYRTGQIKAIIVSGGLGAEGFNEADVMRAFLIAHGVPAGKIIVDKSGNNTRLTAIHTREIMQAHEWHSVIAVSQYYHVPRSKLALRQEGLEQVSGAAAEYRFAWTDPISIAREIAGFYIYLVHR
jgi:vancomycin permeability regulator SanA